MLMRIKILSGFVPRLSHAMEIVLSMVIPSQVLELP